MIVKKPSIYIYVKEPEEALLREICSGIEEEGIFFEVIERDSKDLYTLAFDAANNSMLGSGIGILEGKTALQLKGIKKEQPVFFLEYPTLKEGRILGMNSARALKKLPFKENHELGKG